jgi:hypothetical protein
MTGIRCRWIVALRLRPLVSAAMWRSVPAGSENPMAASRSCACSGESDGGQQRAVEEADVDVAHLALDRLPLLPHLLAGVAELGRAGESPQLFGARGHEVRSAEVPELDAMLEKA